MEKIMPWIRRAWWAVLVAGTGLFLRERYDYIVQSDATAVDALAILVFAGLLLSPLFKEVRLFGFTLKQDIATLKADLKHEMHALRADVQQSLSVQNSFNPQIAFSQMAAPAPDAALRAIEERLPEAIARALRASGLTAPQPASVSAPSSDDQFLWSARVELEREMRRIVRQRELTPYGPKVVGPMDLPNLLVRAELIPPEMGGAIRETYSICSKSLHSETVTASQVSFVRDVAPKLIGALKAIT
jgi:hypothetical protein